MKRNAALLLSTVLFIVMCSAVFAVPQHFAAARFELTAPGNSEILKYYYPAAVELKNDIYNTGGGLEYDFAMNDFLTVGAGFNMHFHSYSNNVASANLEEFNFMAVEPYAVTRAFYKAGKDFEVFAGLGTGLLSLAGSTFTSDITPTAQNLTGACTSFKLFAGVTYCTGAWYNMVEAGYKFAKMTGYEIGGTRAVCASGAPAFADFGGLYLGLSSGMSFGGEKKPKEYHASNKYDWKLFALSGDAATDGTYVQTTTESAAEATAEATPEPTPEPTAAPAAEAKPTETAKVEVEEGGSDNGEGIVIIYPGESSLEELEKSILSRRKMTQGVSGEEGEAGVTGVSGGEGEETTEGEEEMIVSFEAAEDTEEPDIIMVDEKKSAKVESTGYVMVERVGFISDNFSEEGTIYDVNDKALLAQGDFCYMRLSVGKGVKNGTEFIIYDDREEVTDPESGELLGRYISIAGIGKAVEKADENVWKIKIKKSYYPASTGFKIKLRKDIKAYYNKITTKLKKKSAAVEGTIVKIQQGGEGASSKGVVFFNRGLKSGIAPGDRLDVIRPLENKTEVKTEKYHKIGKILVINAMRSSSVGLVMNQSDIIMTGDIVKSVKK